MPNWTFHLLIAAAELGVLGDVLLRHMPWGINLSLCTLALAATVALLPTEHPGPARRDARALLGAGVVTAGAVAWRDAPPLAAANLLATAGLLGLGLLRARGLRLEATVLGDWWRAGTRAAGGVAWGALACLAVPRPEPAVDRRIRAIVTGLVLALPVSAVFGALLAAADPAFERALRTALAWDVEQVASHVAVAAALAWIAAGYLLTLEPAPTVAAAPPTRTTRVLPALGLVELGIPLGGLAALFAAFIGFQARYFFGGDAVILSTAGLGYGDYARRGFFELVTVTGLVVPLLLAADGVADRADPRAVRGFRALAALLLGLVSLIAASAVYRLWLYFGAYGLSASRIYAAAAMLWVGLVLAWFAATVLRGRRQPFALGAIVAGLGVLGCLNLLNPDALVARVNLSRAGAGAELDLEYLHELSADAVPALARAVHDLAPETRCELARTIRQRWDPDGLVDWRTWNLSRARARGTARAVSALCEAPSRRLSVRPAALTLP